MSVTTSTRATGHDLPTAGPVPCRFCRGTVGDLVVDLGHQPSSELFPRAGDPGPDPTFPLRMWLCATCGLAQLADDAEVPEEPAGQEPAALLAQRRAAIGPVTATLPAGATVAEFPSPHGGTWLDLFADHGLPPAAAGARADVVIDACFGLMHAADQRAALQARAARLADGGTLLLQFHSLAAVVEGRQWNAVRLGHYAYYSTSAMVTMLGEVGLTATSAWWFPLYGGTVLVAASRGGRPTDGSLAAVLRREAAVGVRTAADLAPLQRSVEATAEGLRSTLLAARAAGRRVYGYGAASRAVALLRVAGLDAGLLAGVADASPAKQGRRMPGTDIPVIGPADLVAARPDEVLVFVSELVAEARAALPQIEAGGGRWTDAGAGL